MERIKDYFKLICFPNRVWKEIELLDLEINDKTIEINKLKKKLQIERERNEYLSDKLDKFLSKSDVKKDRQK